MSVQCDAANTKGSERDERYVAESWKRRALSYNQKGWQFFFPVVMWKVEFIRELG